MALFKISKGESSRLDSQQWHDGYAYFTTDDGLFHIDYYTENNIPADQQTDLTKQKRIPLNAKNAECDVNGISINENYVKANVLANETELIPKTNSDQLGGLDASEYVTMEYMNYIVNDVIKNMVPSEGEGDSSTTTSSVNLNGSMVEYASFYAPLGSGTAGNLLVSSGSGLPPTWVNTLSTNLSLGSQSKSENISLIFNNQNGSSGSIYQASAYMSTEGVYNIDVYQDNTIVNYLRMNSTETIFQQPVTIASGGTGATTVANAQVSLGVAKAILSITRSGTTYTMAHADGTTSTFTQQDNNTTYSAGTGISLSGTTFSNSGVRSIATGSTNGTISVNTGGTSAEVAVKGLGTAAYTASTAYATASHTHNYLPLAGGTVTGATVFSNTTASTSTTTGAVKIAGGLGVAGNVYGNQVYGAMWNDYAEFRTTVVDVEPGRVVIENGNGSLRVASERLQPGCEVVSDTYGFAIGETEDCKTPIAVSGRVLAYPLEDRILYNPGDAVCSGPDGTVSKMTREEIMMYPERIIGTVSEIPEYETWGSGNVKVKNRIWIRIK